MFTYIHTQHIALLLWAALILDIVFYNLLLSINIVFLAYPCWFIKRSCFFLLSTCSIIRHTLHSTYSFWGMFIYFFHVLQLQTMLQQTPFYKSLERILYVRTGKEVPAIPRGAWNAAASRRTYFTWFLSPTLFLTGVSDQNKDGPITYGRIRSAVNCEP